MNVLKKVDINPKLIFDCWSTLCSSSIRCSIKKSNEMISKIRTNWKCFHFFKENFKYSSFFLPSLGIRKEYFQCIIWSKILSNSDGGWSIYVRAVLVCWTAMNVVSIFSNSFHDSELEQFTREIFQNCLIQNLLMIDICTKFSSQKASSEGSIFWIYLKITHFANLKRSETPRPLKFFLHGLSFSIQKMFFC